MKQFLRHLLVLSLCGPLVSCSVYRQLIGSCKTKISMHIQASDTEHPRAIMKLPIGGRTMTFKKIPEFSHHSIAGFESFPSEDGQGYGLLLQMDAKGKNALETVSRINQGEVLLTFVNGVPVDMVELDRPITDGKFTVWRGVSQESVDELDKYYPRIQYMKSGSKSMDMLPSTYLMKLNAREEAKKREAAEKATEKAKQRDLEKGIIRAAPKTKEIPLEGFKTPGT